MADKKVYDIKINGIDQANEELKDLNKTRYSSFYTNRK